MLHICTKYLVKSSEFLKLFDTKIVLLGKSKINDAWSLLDVLKVIIFNSKVIYKF